MPDVACSRSIFDDNCKLGCWFGKHPPLATSPFICDNSFSNVMLKLGLIRALVNMVSQWPERSPIKAIVLGFKSFSRWDTNNVDFLSFLIIS